MCIGDERVPSSMSQILQSWVIVYCVSDSGVLCRNFVDTIRKIMQLTIIFPLKRRPLYTYAWVMGIFTGLNYEDATEKYMFAEQQLDINILMSRRL